jgi:hypothetical protein
LSNNEVIRVSRPVTICHRDKTIAELVQTRSGRQHKPKFGTLRGRIKINDPNWWHPMSQDEVDAMLLTQASHE